MVKKVEKKPEYRISDENLSKVENYFAKQTIDNGDRRIEATIIQIAEGSGVALATAHKAIQELKNTGKLEKDESIKSRRFPITYTYHGDIEGYEVKNQVEYLQHLVADLQHQVQELTSENLRLAGEVRILKNNSVVPAGRA